MFMLTLVLIYLALALALWGLTRFAQGFMYTESAPGLHWRAPLAALGIWLFAVALPAWFNASGKGNRWPAKFDDMLLFTSGEGDVSEFKTLIHVADDGKETTYSRRKGGRGLVQYLDTAGKPLPSAALVVFAVTDNGDRIRFEAKKDKDGYIDRDRGYARYVDDKGRVMLEEDIGRLTSGGSGQIWLTIFGLLLSMTAWFLCLWLLCLFQWKHALAFAIPVTFLFGFVMNFVKF